mmetsp:Transcript_17494/g.42705  ORF Transcript_17494/g.42705 Transcript_17494/m.42705 type:complete len:121 (+) Transcript_17494:3-365(+)
MMGEWDMVDGGMPGDQMTKRKRGRPKGVKDLEKRTRRTKKEMGIATKKELRAAGKVPQTSPQPAARGGSGRKRRQPKTSRAVKGEEEEASVKEAEEPPVVVQGEIAPASQEADKEAPAPN